jgi:hypothetical protein
MRRWSENEWAHCLHCFYRSETTSEGAALFLEKYPDRNECAIKEKFRRESVNINEYTGGGLGKSKVTKHYLIQELKQVYKLLGQSFNKSQFNELSETKYETVVGYFGTWEKALKEANLFNKFDTILEITKEIKSFNPEKEIKEKWEQQKEKILRKAEDKKIAWLRDQANKVDIVNQMILEAVAKADPILVEVHRKPKIDVPKTKPVCTLWFEFSDLQLGTLLTSEEMGGINQHNWYIWQEKLNIWKKQVIEKIDAYRQQYLIDQVVIAALGDFVEGNNIFKGQAWKVDTNVVDQAINGANDTAAAFIEIMLTYPDIHFDIFEVFGNHGRIGEKGENPYSCSMDKVYLRMLQSQLCRVAELKNYAYHKNESWFYFIEIYGWHHLLLHGDQGMSKLWSSRPTVNSLEKGLVRYNQLLQQQVHFLHVGHFHNDWQLSFNLSQMLINGSWIGTSNFSASVMVASSPPIQTMHVFEPRIGLAKTERIYLVEGPVRKPVKPKTLGATP